MNKFIAAMDNSGGSAGGVLDLYGQEWNEENKMERIHEFRMRQINSPAFNSDNIWAGIVYKDSVDRGIVDALKAKGIETYLKIDSGVKEDGTLKDFDVATMALYAANNGCTGTKMRSLFHTITEDTKERSIEVVSQQLFIAQTIIDAGLTPIVEPEIDINMEEEIDTDQGMAKISLERWLEHILYERLEQMRGQVILKLTIPHIENKNLYSRLANHPNVKKVVALSGGYSTEEACKRLKQVPCMSASFSRALAEGLKYQMTDDEFHARIEQNILEIVEASS